MANPQREHGHIDIANEIAKALCRLRLSGRAWQVLWVVLYKTWGFVDPDEYGNLVKNGRGFVRKKKTDRISLSQISEMTGIAREKCPAVIRQLVQRNIVVRHATQNGRSMTYGFRKDYERWAVLPRKALPKTATKVLPKRALEMLPKMATTKESFKESPKVPSNLKDRFDSTVLSLSHLLKDKILKNKPDRKNPDVRGKPWLEKTADAIDKLIRIDRRPPERIRAIIEFCQADSKPRGRNGFHWSKNILSGDKLRKQFDALEDDMGDREKMQKPQSSVRNW